MTLSNAFSSRLFAEDTENAPTGRIWGAEITHDAAPVAVAGFRPVEGGFRSLYTAPAGQQTAALRGELMSAEPVDAMEEARMEAFTMGFEEGCRITSEGHAADVEAQARLAEALEMLSPAPSGMLSTMLSATVVRLVEQIVGEVEIDMERLVQRCDTVAAFIESNQDRSALHVHPEDADLLKDEAIGVPLVADKTMQRGCVRLETADGWVEDGPDVRLSRLRALLDDMEGKA